MNNSDQKTALLKRITSYGVGCSIIRRRMRLSIAKPTAKCGRFPTGSLIAEGELTVHSYLL